jgi:hypothetical protein
VLWEVCGLTVALRLTSAQKLCRMSYSQWGPGTVSHRPSATEVEQINRENGVHT